MKNSNQDTLQKFMIEEFNVRGVIVHLNESIKTILSQHPYPKQIQTLLGETLLAASLLLRTIKLNGRMTIQFQSHGAIKMLVAQINDQGQMRGLAKWEPKATPADLASGLKTGELVITIFHKNQETPYQSIVPLYNNDIASAITHYFTQSEQLPTQFYLTVSEDGAAGLLLQMMPEKDNTHRDIQWQALMSHMKEFSAKHLIGVDNAAFLKTTFPDQNIRLFDAEPLMFKCSCSVNKMKNSVFTMGKEEAVLILKTNREILVTCEYCNNQYGFDENDVASIFSSDTTH